MRITRMSTTALEALIERSTCEETIERAEGELALRELAITEEWYAPPSNSWENLH